MRCQGLLKAAPKFVPAWAGPAFEPVATDEAVALTLDVMLPRPHRQRHIGGLGADRPVGIFQFRAVLRERFGEAEVMHASLPKR
jgi:hypothetical protein